MSADRAPVAMTCAHHELVAGGARMGERGGWSVPLSFRGAGAEATAARAAAGMAEQGHLAKIRVQGPGSGAVLAALGAEPPVGATAPLEVPAGGAGVRVEAARLAPDEAWITGPPGSAGALADALGGMGGEAAVFDVTGSHAGMRLVGPASPRVIASLTELNVRDGALPDGACAQTMAADVYALVVRADAGGLASYRLFFGREYGLYAYGAVLEAGRPLGMELIGEEALAALGCST